MAQISGIRDTNQAITEQRLVRYVREGGMLLEPNEQPLITFLMKLGGSQVCTSPRIEWFEDDFVARWALNGSATVAASTSSTTVTVTDGTLFQPYDLFCIPNAASSSTQPEICRVTAVSTNTLTVQRGFAGTTAVSITPGKDLAILGTAFEEGAAVSIAKTTAPAVKTSFTEIFKKSINLTNTQIASKVYDAPSGERKREHEKLLKQMKVDMNRSFLFGKASETLAGGGGGNALRTTMGLNSVISTNTTNASGTLSLATLMNFAEQSFRYGSPEKLLVAAPKIVSAINYWGSTKLQIQPGGKVFGVNVDKVNVGHGVWYLVRDWMLENGSGASGFAGWGFSIDTDELQVHHLSGNGLDRSLRIIENAVRDGADRVIDEATAECGLSIKHEKKHAKLYNVTGYSTSF